MRTSEQGSRVRIGRTLAFVLIAVSVAIALATLQAAAEAPGLEGGGGGRMQLFASVTSSGDLARSGDTITLRVRVLDQFGVVVEGATVSASATEGSISPKSALTDRDGFARFTFSLTTTASAETTVHFLAAKGDAFVDEATHDLVILPVVRSTPIVMRPETAVGAGVAAAVLAALASTEFGKYGLSNLLLFPLYSRLRKEEVLDHFVRGQIYGYILSHAGEHYSALKDALRVTNGTLAHHLRTLEMQGFIKAERDGVFKRFYPAEVQIPRNKGIRLSDLQHHMLSMIRSEGGPSQQQIAEHLGASQQRVSYNLRHLSREGLIRMEKEGRTRRYFPASSSASDV